MRIVSQDGMIDLPYELVGVSISFFNSEEIIAYPAVTYLPHKGGWTMARYSTDSKAKKAMEMLRNAYSPKTNIEEPTKKEFLESRYSNQSLTIAEAKVEVLNNFYFRFPKDDEIDV